MSAEYSDFSLPGRKSIREKMFTDFYSRIIRDYFTIDHCFISNVKHVLDRKVLPNTFDFVNYLEYDQCAYLLQFGVHDTCLGLEKFFESAMEYTKLIQRFSTKGRVNVCCLGSQGLFAVLGICKVIEESVKQFGFLDDDPTLVQILIIDRDETWKRLSEHVVTAAKKEYTRLNLKLDFLVDNMTKDFSDDAMLRIEKSHIIAMVKFLSNLPSERTVMSITKIVLAQMKKNAVLFYLDHDTEGHLKTVKSLTDSSKSFSIIKSPRVPRTFVLHDYTRLFHERSYKHIYPLNLCWNTSFAPVIFSTWIKNPKIDIALNKEKQTAAALEKLQNRFYKAKPSNNKLRNSNKTFELVGSLAHVDMEKKNKDDTHRQRAKRKADFRSAKIVGLGRKVDVGKSSSRR